MQNSIRLRGRPGLAGQRVATAAGLLTRLGIGGLLGGRLKAKPRPPSFRQITFRRGTVYTARFTADGAGIVYAAEWDGRKRELFATIPGSVESRALGVANADVAAMLEGGEVGLLNRSAGGFSSAVLARMALAGGPAKDLLENVNWVDCHSNGRHMALIRWLNGKPRLEFPAGKTIYEGNGSLSYCRVSPSGHLAAFIDASDPNSDSGSLVVVSDQGKELVRSAPWKSIEGLAWRNDQEVWFCAAKEGHASWLYAMNLQGALRLLDRAPARLVLHDLARDGRVVAERNTYRAFIQVLGPIDNRERDLSWLDFSEPARISRDGTTLLFSETGDGAGPRNLAYLRQLDGSAPVRLGEGFGLALSDDRTQALLVSEAGETHLEVVPVGPGRNITLDRGKVSTFSWGAFLATGQQIVFQGSEPGKPPRLYLQNLAGGQPMPLSPEGLQLSPPCLSPDGREIAAVRDGVAVLLSLAEGSLHTLEHLPAGHQPLGWSDDGRYPFVKVGQQIPIKILRFELVTGQLAPWRELHPTDASGIVGLGRISLSGDGSVLVYEMNRLFSDLYIIENLE